MVGDLEEARRKPPRHGREQCLLAGDLDVAREQRDASTPRDPQHERGVVDLPVATEERTTRRRPQDLDVEIPDAGALPGRRLCHHDTAFGGHVRDPLAEVVLDRDGAPPQRPDAGVPEHVDQPAGVVGVRVAHDHHVEPVVPVASQPRGGTAVGAGVDQHARVGRLDQDGVALADVDGRDAQVLRGAADDRQPRHDERDRGGPGAEPGEPGAGRGQDPRGGRRGEHDGERSRGRHHPAPPGQPVRRPEDHREGGPCEHDDHRGRTG